ncbi:Calx-beta domain-containing protein, partial [Roseibium sp. RKSG952]|uniref:Calx-beta domain-containing protein n=1 Tax=Roseibium sp. RKSG952 TaxID=2529384 RepID=UPI0012BB8C0B
NGTLAAGQSASFGFQANGTDTEITFLSMDTGDGNSDADGSGGDSPADPAAPLPEVSITNAQATEEEGVASVTVSLSETSDQDVTLFYETHADTAGNSDFAAGDGTVVIPAGSLSASISIALTDDDVVEADETFHVMITSVDGAEIGNAMATVQILNTDVSPDPGADDGSDTGTDPVEDGTDYTDITEWGSFHGSSSH